MQFTTTASEFIKGIFFKTILPVIFTFVFCHSYFEMKNSLAATLVNNLETSENCTAEFSVQNGVSIEGYTMLKKEKNYLKKMVKLQLASNKILDKLNGVISSITTNQGFDKLEIQTRLNQLIHSKKNFSLDLLNASLGLGNETRQHVKELENQFNQSFDHKKRQINQLIVEATITPQKTVTNHSNLLAVKHLKEKITSVKLTKDSLIKSRDFALYNKQEEIDVLESQLRKASTNINSLREHKQRYLERIINELDEQLASLEGIMENYRNRGNRLGIPKIIARLNRLKTSIKETIQNDNLKIVTVAQP